MFDLFHTPIESHRIQLFGSDQELLTMVVKIVSTNLTSLQ